MKTSNAQEVIVIAASEGNLELKEEEFKLYRTINNYRSENDLKKIPLSLNLSKVAKTHAKDLYYNSPHKKRGCDMHSWSDEGDWEGCCYTSDHKNAECMWLKPKEITDYKGYGYEIVFFYSPVTDNISLAEKSVDAWKQSPGHSKTILNEAPFDKIEWNAIGVGIYKEFVTVWFGKEQDESSEVTVY